MKKSILFLLVALSISLISCTKEPTVEVEQTVITYTVTGDDYDVVATIGNGKSILDTYMGGINTYEYVWETETNPFIKVKANSDQCIEIRIFENGKLIKSDDLCVAVDNWMELWVEL